MGGLHPVVRTVLEQNLAKEIYIYIYPDRNVGNSKKTQIKCGFGRKSLLFYSGFRTVGGGGAWPDRAYNPPHKSRKGRRRMIDDRFAVVLFSLPWVRDSTTYPSLVRPLKLHAPFPLPFLLPLLALHTTPTVTPDTQKYYTKSHSGLTIEVQAGSRLAVALWKPKLKSLTSKQCL